MLFHRAALLMSRQTLTYLSGIIRRHRKSIGSRYRKLNPGQQALLVLAYLREGHSSMRAALIYQHRTAQRDKMIADAISERVSSELTETARPSGT